MKYVVVGTAGHIDHGKSALVRALTGIDPDRLEEEKRRGITIDLGFAHLALGEGLRVAFIDVPGHERFVKNMLAGVGGIDLVMLVIAADESIKPQSREHFAICRLLGIEKGLVAITKADLVDSETVDLVRLEVQDFVAGSFLEGAPVVGVSARTGLGLETLQAELRRLSLEVPPRATDLPFRLPIDRAFVMKGFGAVVTGTLLTGQIRKESEVEIFPTGQRARVRGIEVHNAPAEVAAAGQRTALNLVGVEAQELARGMVLAPPGLFRATTRLEATLTLLPSARPVKSRAPVHFHCGTAEMVAEVVLLGARELAPGESGYVQLRLAEPGLFLPGDRFIVRQFSPLVTLGGGVVLDAQAPKHRLDDPRVTAFLQGMEHGTAEARLELLTQQSGEASVPSLVARTGWAPAALLQVAQRLAQSQRLLILGQPPSVLVHREHFDALARDLTEQLAKFHTANPLVPGIAKEELRGLVGGPALSPLLFNAELEQLAAEKKAETRGETVRLLGREVRLNPEESAAREQIVKAFAQAGLAVPSAREVLAGLRLDRARAQKILQLLLKEGELVKLAEDLVFHRSALARLRELVVKYKSRSNRVNVAAFKEITGLSRKYAIPLLEYLDREHVTRREGDARVIL
jgi:selenocysteine-specific elongation factor